MKLQVIGTGSSGNAYVLQAGGNTGQSLLLDAGLPESTIIRSIDGFRKLVGCLITHEHQDHAKSAEKLAIYGLPVYTTQGTIDAIRTDSCLTRFNAVLPRLPFSVGEFTVTAFETEHDAAEPCGWLIRYEPTGETALYATDTFYLRYTFPGIHYWIVECNYVDSIMQEQAESGEIDEKMRHRLMTSHMSLRRLCDALAANDLTETRAIVLVHLSDQRSDERLMVETIKNVTGIDDVWAAQAGKTYDLRLTPF